MRISDWSSDVCSSDLTGLRGGAGDPMATGLVARAQAGPCQRVTPSWRHLAGRGQLHALSPGARGIGVHAATPFAVRHHDLVARAAVEHRRPKAMMLAGSPAQSGLDAVAALRAQVFVEAAGAVYPLRLFQELGIASVRERVGTSGSISCCAAI